MANNKQKSDNFTKWMTLILVATAGGINYKASILT